MRFIDYNGSGGLDPQDIAVSVVVDEQNRDDGGEDGSAGKRKPLEANSGCATMIALVALPALIILSAL